MKLTFFLLLIALWTTITDCAAQITLSGRNIPLQKAFSAIQKQTRYVFWYQDAEIKKAKQLNIVVKNATVEEVLDLCLRDQPFDYKIIDSMIIVRSVKTESVQETGSSEQTGVNELINVKGIVYNEKGKPAEGVLISIEGARISVLTNACGEFSLNTVRKNKTFVIKHVSLEQFKFKFNPNGKSSRIIVSLRNKIRGLEAAGQEELNSNHYTSNLFPIKINNF